MSVTNSQVRPEGLLWCQPKAGTQACAGRRPAYLLVMIKNNDFSKIVTCLPKSKDGPPLLVSPTAPHPPWLSPPRSTLYLYCHTYLPDYQVNPYFIVPATLSGTGLFSPSPFSLNFCWTPSPPLAGHFSSSPTTFSSSVLCYGAWLPWSTMAVISLTILWLLC